MKGFTIKVQHNGAQRRQLVIQLTPHTPRCSRKKHQRRAQNPLASRYRKKVLNQRSDLIILNAEKLKMKDLQLRASMMGHSGASWSYSSHASLH
jgi:hypothetical protein